MKYFLPLFAFIFLFCLPFRGTTQTNDKRQKHEEIFLSDSKFFACDINGDGISDVIYTAMLRSRKSLAGCIAKAFYGTPGGLSSQAAWTFTGTDTIQSLHTLNFDFDINNDGMKDLLAIADIEVPKNRSIIVAIVVVYNSREGFKNNRPVILQEINITKEYDKEIICDYNKDGFPDVIVQSWNQPPSYGHIERTKFKTQIVYGSGKAFSDLQDLNLEMEDQQPDIYTGFDYDNDKVPDLVLETSGRTVEFALYLTKRNKIQRWLTIHYPLFSAWRYDFHGVGDINGDHYNDACVLRLESSKDVVLTVFPGSADSLGADTLLSYDFHKWDFSLFLSPLGDFDGNGSNDMFLGNDAFYSTPILQGDTASSNGFTSGPLPFSFYKHLLRNILIWGGSPPKIDSVGNEKFSEFVQSHSLRVQAIGDINGDKKDDLLLYNNAKQFIIYGNKERKFDPVEWVHK